MKPQQNAITSFISLFNICTKFFKADDAALKQMNKLDYLEALNTNYVNKFGFYSAYLYSRRQKAVLLNKDEEQRSSVNRQLQLDDEAFWNAVTLEQFNQIAKSQIEEPSTYYCREIRSALPIDIVDSVNALIKAIPQPPKSQTEYIVQKMMGK